MTTACQGTKTTRSWGLQPPNRTRLVHFAVVEQRPENRELMRSAFILRRIAYSFYTASSELLTQLNSTVKFNHLDAVILNFDLGPDDLDWITTLPKIKQLAQAPVIAYADPVLVEAAMVAGFNGFLSQPLDLDNFHRLIDIVLADGNVWAMQQTSEAQSTGSYPLNAAPPAPGRFPSQESATVK